MRKTLLKALSAGRLLKDKWVVIFLSLAIIFAGAGLYFNTQPEWTQSTHPGWYNQGVASYLQDHVDDSQAQFAYVALESEDPILKSLALYNLGTMIGQWLDNEEIPVYIRFQLSEIAIANLRGAVWFNPGDEEAKYNLEFLRKKQFELFMEMQEEMGEGSQPQPGPEYNPGEEDAGY